MIVLHTLYNPFIQNVIVGIFYVKKKMLIFLKNNAVSQLLNCVLSKIVSLTVLLKVQNLIWDIFSELFLLSDREK